MTLFSVHSTRGDVEDLMARLAQKIRQQEATGSFGSSDTSLFPGSNDAADVQEQLRIVTAQWSINSAEIVHSTRPGLASLIIRFQRLVHRLTWWYLNPIVDQIIAFNSTVVRILTALQAQQEELRDSLENLHEKRPATSDEHPAGAPLGLAKLSALTRERTSNNVHDVVPGDHALTDEIREVKEAMADLGRRLEALERTARMHENP